MEEMAGKETDRKMTGDKPRADKMRGLLWKEVGSCCCVETQVAGIGQDEGLDDLRSWITDIRVQVQEDATAQARVKSEGAPELGAAALRPLLPSQTDLLSPPLLKIACNLWVPTLV